MKWPVLQVWVFIVQLVEHCSAKAEAMGLNPNEALPPPISFGGRGYFTVAQIAITTAMVTYSFHLYFCSSHNFILSSGPLTPPHPVSDKKAVEQPACSGSHHPE